MRSLTYSLVTALLLLATEACQKATRETPDGEVGPNQALYDEVMGIHDEVMPKMNDLYRLKTLLKTRLAESPAMPEPEKAEINTRVARIDSASENMMIWMRQFNPLPDTEGEEKAREYLESELRKVKKVRADILEALDPAP